MRNLKRALSLVLAAAMLIGMMVVSASAAGKDFGDQAEIKNTEAVAVMSALKVLEGTNKGDFNPTGILTREQAAKIICYMMMGPANAEKLSNNSSIFSDVAANRWSAPFIAYCANLGILAGAGDGTFNPEGELTGIAFGKMLLVALGYDAKIEGYVGKDWSTNIAVDMVSAGIAVDGIVLSDPLSRDNAAQMAFQALTANMVSYSSKGTEVTTSDGTSIVIGASDAAPVAAGTVEYNTMTVTPYTQFCEKYFPKLQKQAGADDDFGRPADYKWVLDTKDVFNAAKTPVVTYTAFTLPADVAKDLKGYTFNGTKLVDKDTPIGANVAPIGESGSFGTANTTKIANTISALTGNGKLVEIYANATTKAVEDVVVVTYTMGKVTNVVTNSKGDVTYTIDSTDDVVYADKDAGTDGIKFAGAAPAKGDYVTYTDESGVRYAYPMTSFEGKMTKYNTTLTTMVVDGTTYVASSAGVGSTGLTAGAAFRGTANSKFYVDQYGYVVAVDGINDVKYAVLDSIAYVGGSGVSGSGYVEARLVFTDGKADVVKVATGLDKYFIVPGTDLSAYDVTSGPSGDPLTTSAVAGTSYTGYLSAGDSTTAVQFYCVASTAASNASVTGSIYNYSVSDDKYTLADEGTIAANNATFTKGVPTIGTLGGVANNNTVYVVKTMSGTTPKWNVYTGYKSVPSMTTGTIKADYATTTTAGMVFCYVDATGASNIGDATYDVAFFFSNAFTVDNSDPNKPLYEYSAILNGTLTTVVATADLSVSANTLYKVTLNDNGQVTAVAAASTADYISVTANGATAAVNGVLTIDSTTINGLASQTALTYGEDTTVYFVNTTAKTVSTGSMESVKDNAVMYVKTVDKTTDAGKIAISVAYVLVSE